MEGQVSPPAKSKVSMGYLRTFVLLKHDAPNGAGRGAIAAIGAVMPSGKVVVEWTADGRAITVFESVDALLVTQNHDRRATIRWGLWEDDE